MFGIISAAAGAASLPLSMVAAPTSAVATSTSVVGVAQSCVSHQSGDQSKREESSEPDLANDPRLAKFTLSAHDDSGSSVMNEIHDMQVVLQNKKVCTMILSVVPAATRYPLALSRLCRSRESPFSRRTPVFWLLSQLPNRWQAHGTCEHHSTRSSGA